MNASLRTIFAATFLAVTASAGQAASPRIIRDDAVSSRHVAAPSSLTTTFSLARVTVNGTTKPPGHALDNRLGTSPALDRASESLGGLVCMAICTGC
jgi:hypothetical protein